MPVIRNINETDNSQSNKQISASRRINKKMDLLDKKMDSLYNDIYISRSDNRKNMSSMINNLDTAIDDLQNLDSEVSVSGMSELLRRIGRNNGVKEDQLMNNVEDLFNDSSLISSLYQNDELHKYISAQNYQYDMICKYLPKLQDALEIKRDNVLCSDNLSKEFINPQSNKSNKEEVNKFASNATRLETEYELDDFLDKVYMTISKYGEDFIYIVPYGKAFQRLLDRNSIHSGGIARLGSYYESSIIDKNHKSKLEEIKIVSESYTSTSDFKLFLESTGSDTKFTNFKGFDVNITYNDSNVLYEPVNERYVITEKKALEKIRSLSSLHEAQIFDSVYDKSTKSNPLSAASNDGLIIPDKLSGRDSKGLEEINGAVVERLKRENVIPIYIGKRCLGYYYLDFVEDKNACGYCGGNHAVPGSSNVLNSYNKAMSEDQQDLAIRYICSKMSDQIDAHFINANKDLKEEIYSVLRYNEKFDITRTNNINVTFIPAEDMIHCYFELDEDTHRGISDLQKAVIPAMLYVLLYLTDIIGKITRSTDKRIYYVKQNVESNVARTMMNVVQQIKKGNMGMRQIESMNNILNIVGKYNDYIIPVGQSGDPPIQFEVMNGQEINTPTEIMEKMEEAAVNTIIPFEFVNSTYQQDFAIRFTMSNTRFLKSIYTRQRKTQNIFSKIYTKIYNYEYDNTDSIKIILPPPTYLTMTNNSQLIDNITQMADKIIEVELADQDDEVKNEFKKLYIRNSLSTYIDFDKVERLKMTAKTNVETNKNPQVEGSSDDDENMDDYM